MGKFQLSRKLRYVLSPIAVLEVALPFLSVDERTNLCPPNAPPEEDVESDPPTYGVEMDQNVSVVCVQGGPQAPQVMC